MELYIDLLTKGVIFIVVGMFFWKVWPIVKEWAIVKQALAIVHQMEEEHGAGSGAIKFDAAVELLQAFVDKLGWKLNVEKIGAYITSAVGMLHAEQGVVPAKKEEPPGEVE